MKTPDEIKKGLEYLSIKDVARKLDAWEEGIAYDYVEDVAADALALIQQLEADNAQLNRCIENMTDMLNAAHDETAKLKAERDAAVKDCSRFMCETCAEKDNGDNCSWCAVVNGCRNGYVWRGVQKEE